jgi:hypothetical protein
MDRTIHEVLNPTFLDIEEMFFKDFQGMTIEDVYLDELKEARVRLVDSIKDSLNREDKEFLLAFKRGNPDWTYFLYRGLIKESWRCTNNIYETRT